MESQDYKLFPQKYIDEINAEVDNNYFTPVWEEILSNIKIEKLLDVGCGNGVFSSIVKKKTGCKLIGVDGNQYALELASRSEIGFDGVSLLNDFNTDPLPFGKAAFNFVVCKDVFEHLINPVFLLKEINRILKNDGYLLLHIPNHFPLIGRVKFLLNNRLDTFNYFPSAELWEFPHIRFFTYESILKLCSINGFILKLNLSYLFPKVPFAKLLPNTLKKAIINHNPSQFAEGFTLLLSKSNNKEL